MEILDKYIKINKIKTLLLIVTYVIAVIFVVHLSLVIFFFAGVTFYNIVITIFEEGQLAISYLAAYSRGWIVILPLSILAGALSLLLTLLYMHKDTEYAADIALRNFELTPITMNEFKTLNNIVANLSLSANIMAPKLAIYDVSGANAFSVGLDRNNSTIVLTYGLISTLKGEELEAVLAHEVAHIASNDTRMMMIFHYLSSMISFITKAKTTSIEYKAKGNIFMRMYLFIVSLGVLAFYPILKKIVGPSREYMADEIAVNLTNNPRALANTVLKVSAISHVSLIASEHYGTLAFTAATDNFGNFYGKLFNKHPNLGDRVNHIMEAEYEEKPNYEEIKES